ncbi:MAG: DUF4203 domain-containing protein [Vicinamibacterales bacterium]
MLPHGFEQPGAALLLIAGVLACFAGHRFFRLVLGLYGFLIGAMVASSIVGVSNNTGMLIAALVGGVIGSVVLVFAWFAGVSLVGAGIGVLLAHEVWRFVGTGDPSSVLVVAAAVAGAIAALFVQRYVIIIGTAFAGAWTIVLAVSSFFPKGLVRGASKTEVWILYPTSSLASWAPLAALALGVVGTFVQLSGRGGKRR